MMPWQRAPREVYRVYGEDEYLAAEDRPASEQPYASAADSIGEDSPSALVSPIPGGLHPGRLMGLGLLVGVTIGAVGLIVVNMSHRSPPPKLGTSRSTPVRVSGLSQGARNTSSEVPFGRQSEVKPSAGKRPLGHISMSLPIRRSASQRAQKSTRLRTSGAPAPSLKGQVSMPQSEASLVAGEFDFER
jgi:hypothetical protein